VLVGFDELEEVFEVVVFDVGVDQLFAFAVHETDVHLARVQVDSAVVLGSGSVIFHTQLNKWRREAPVNVSNVNAGSVGSTPRPIDSDDTKNPKGLKWEYHGACTGRGIALMFHSCIAGPRQ
jgi:hypothetical protein